MKDGRHEAAQAPWRQRLEPIWDQIAYRAKAVLAGLGATVAGEAVLLLTTATFQEQVAGLVPPAWAWAVPPLLGAVAGSITHQVTNGPKPRDDGEDEASVAGP